MAKRGEIEMPDYIETLGSLGISEGGIAYYCLTKEDVVSGRYFPQISATMNAYFNPYLNFGNLKTEVENITENIQTAGGSDGEGWMGSVKRITGYNALTESIVEFEPIDRTGLTIGGKWNWRNESKCHCAPFTLLSYEDGLSEPLTIYPQYCEDGTNHIMVRAALNQMGYYLLYVEGYRGDDTGLVYGVISQSPPIPTVTNAYSDYMTINKERVFTERLLAGSQIVASVATSVATGNPLGLITASSGATDLMNSFLNERALKAQANTVNATNSNYAFSLQQNIFGQMYQYQYPEDVMERIGLFFHQYGYAQNKLMKPNLRGRYFFNYIKTKGANIKGEGIPKEHFSKLKNIYNNGTTIWHIDRNEVVVGDYSKDNYEV